MSLSGQTLNAADNAWACMGVGSIFFLLTGLLGWTVLLLGAAFTMAAIWKWLHALNAYTKREPLRFRWRAWCAISFICLIVLTAIITRSDNPTMQSTAQAEPQLAKAQPEVIVAANSSVEPRPFFPGISDAFSPDTAPSQAPARIEPRQIRKARQGRSNRAEANLPHPGNLSAEQLADYEYPPQSK